MADYPRPYPIVPLDVVVGDVTVENTVTETTIYSTTIAANFLTVGRMFVVRVYGKYSTHSNAHKFTLKLKLGTTALISVQSPANNVTDKEWHARYTVTCRSVGVSGTITAFGEIDCDGKNVDGTTLSPVGIDTTGINMFTLTCEWTHAFSDDSLTVQQGYTRRV